jgi:hypothetical protein
LSSWRSGYARFVSFTPSVSDRGILAETVRVPGVDPKYASAKCLSGLYGMTHSREYQFGVIHTDFGEQGQGEGLMK